jgi:formate dehydrogenase iron-sulfur subunit
MCSRRVANGDAPACVTVCPTNVMKFGEHEELLKEAKEILAGDSRYVKHIYGEEEAGGTAWIYISDKPFESLGFKMNVPKQSLPSYTKDYMHATPKVGLIWAAILACLYFITRRRSGKKDEPTASQKTEPKA